MSDTTRQSITSIIPLTQHPHKEELQNHRICIYQTHTLPRYAIVVALPLSKGTPGNKPQRL